MRIKPTMDRLREVLDYDPTIGILRWRVTNSNVAPAGNEAGTYDGRYVRVSVDGVKMLAHRVIWAIVTGEWPPADVDHEDNDGYNNRWRNLRLATMSQNIANSKRSKNCTTGFKGVTPAKNGRFRAQIGHSYGKRYLGTYDTAEQAHAVYLAEAERLYGEFARPE